MQLVLLPQVLLLARKFFLVSIILIPYFLLIVIGWPRTVSRKSWVNLTTSKTMDK